jgi:hypothetical protein
MSGCHKEARCLDLEHQGGKDYQVTTHPDSFGPDVSRGLSTSAEACMRAIADQGPQRELIRRTVTGYMDIVRV